MKLTISDLKLSAQQALLGNVFPKLRSVSIEMSNSTISICFFCDGEITENERQLCENVVDEVFADFSHLKNVEFEDEIIVVEFPHPIPLKGFWVYYRYE